MWKAIIIFGGVAIIAFVVMLAIFMLYDWLFDE